MSQKDELSLIPSVEPSDSREQEIELNIDVNAIIFNEMDGILHQAMIPEMRGGRAPGSWTAPESWCVVVKGGADIEGESDEDEDTGGMSAAQPHAQHKIRIRIYKADNTYHVVSVSTNMTVAALTPKLDQKLPAGEEREMHQLYLKEHGRGEFPL
jgi:hypothetical protein